MKLCSTQLSYPKQKNKHSISLSQETTTSRLLQQFKSLWGSGAWSEALLSYRTWTKRTGKKRDTLIEGELLFRCASSCFEEGDYQLKNLRSTARQMSTGFASISRNGSQSDQILRMCAQHILPRSNISPRVFVRTWSSLIIGIAQPFIVI